MPAAVVTTIAGKSNTPGPSDGTGSAAAFSLPGQMTTDSAGNLYVTDSGNYAVRLVTPAGVVTTLAGTVGSTGSTDGPVASAKFSSLNGIALYGTGTIYIADRFNHTIRKITGGTVSTFAGLAATSGTTDANGGTARFNTPLGIAVDGSGTVYVADQNNHTIRAITPAGDVTTLAGTAGSSGNSDGKGSLARFWFPQGLVCDAAGNIYVADSANSTIRMVTPAGVVTTIAGLAGTSGSADGTGSAARFKNPIDLAIDSGGNLFVSDNGNQTIRKITPSGVVTTVVGVAGSIGVGLKALPATLNLTWGIAVSKDRLYMATENSIVYAEKP